MTLIKAFAAAAAGTVLAASAFAQSARSIPSPAQTTNFFLLEDLDNVNRTKTLSEDDLNALQVVAGWIKTFVARPHKDLGRAGPVCPFVPTAIERKTLWLAPQRIADRTPLEVVQLINGYKKLLLDAQPIDGDDANYKTIVVVFTDLSSDRAKTFFDEVLQHLGVQSYAEDGLVLGGFYESNEGTAVYNPSFLPFTAPVPFLLMRHAVISDWKFFLDKDEWLKLWARHHGESAVQTLGAELRRLPWRVKRD